MARDMCRIETKEKIIGDVLEEIPKLKYHINLIVTDPPYNIGWKYGDKTKDKRKDYHEWCVEWAVMCMEKLQPSGVMCIINYPENNNRLYVALVDRGYNFVQQLIWNYPTNVGHSKTKYTRSYRTILVFSKDKKYRFEPVKQPYKNPTDKRIQERISAGHKGTNHYDVFTINLCKNVSKDKKNNGINQLPRELVEMLIKTYSEPLDTVLDPFVGNGTVMDIAYEMNRTGVGIDLHDYQNI